MDYAISGFITIRPECLERRMAEQTHRERARNTGQHVYTMVLQVIAAVVVLLIFAGLAYLVSVDRVDAGALLLYAGVLLGYILNTVWHRRRG